MSERGTKQPSTSAELAGGTGFTFEDTVVAYYLASLLRQERAAGQEGIVTRVAVQQAGHGHPLDDVIIEFKHDEVRRRLSLQIKRRITISAAESNSDFRGIVACSVATRSTPDFQPDLDVYGFAVEHVAVAPFRTLIRIIDLAKSSPTGNDFTRRFSASHSVAVADSRLRDQLLPLIGAESPDDEANFYRQFIGLKFDALANGGALRTEIVNRLQELIAHNKDGSDILLFDRLCHIAREGAGTSQVWTRHSLLDQLRGTVRLNVIPNYRADIARINTFSRAGMADVSEEIDGYRVDRPSIEEKVRDQLAEYRLVNISGLPGCGKSAILKRVMSEYAAEGPVLFLKSDRLIETSWLPFAETLGIQLHDITNLLAEISSAGTPILAIDGIDRIRPDQKGIITDILRAIESNEHLSDWKVLASSRDQGLEAYRTWFPSTFYQGTGIGNVSVEAFNDNEAKTLAQQKPNLRQLLFGATPIREIARRPFFAEVLARSISEEAITPQTEVDLINAWWSRGGHNAPKNAVPQRQRALLDFAMKGVRNLGKGIPTNALKDASVEHIDALKRDRVIREDEDGAFFSFTHDIFFEWVFFRLLIEAGPGWKDRLTEAGEPPLLGRVVGLLAQHKITSPEKWSKGYRKLETEPLRPQWHREWLTAPPLTPAFAQNQTEFQTLLYENDYALFEKLLVWFQAQHTIPNPVILQQNKEPAEGAEHVRMADMLSWPSDFEGWGRFLDWLIPLAPELPTRLLPNVIEVFSVWQNAFSGVQNSRSLNILGVCGGWLISLEEFECTEDFSERTGKWNELGHETRSHFVTSLRIIILRTAQTYPDPAIAIFKRAIADDRIRKMAYADLVCFSAVMAEIAPDLLTSLAKAELLEELPQERLDRIEQEKRDHKEQLDHIRKIPEQDRTEYQQHILKHEHMYFSIGFENVDLDDIGINRHHQFYYPPSALHEPFASLFGKKPEAAIQLMRDFANQATRGWRQVHNINRDSMGTPIPVVLNFPWGEQEFWGDWHVYSWSMGELASDSLACAFLALSHWAFKQIEKGQPTDEIIQAVVEENECYAVLGLALALALETFHVSEATLPIVTCQRLWHHDIRRFSQEEVRDIDWFGLEFMPRLTNEQIKAKEYLKTRASRSHNIRELAMWFTLGPDKNLRNLVKEALARFPDDLPHEVEETRLNPKFTESLKRDAEQYAGLGDAKNYRKQTTSEGQSVVYYQAPEPTTPEQTREIADATKYLQETAIIGWVKKSLDNNILSDEIALTDAVNIAQARDNSSMFTERHDIGNHTTQSMVASVAACTIQFDSANSKNYNWALDVLARIERMKERQDTFYESPIPWHPAIFLAFSLARLREINPSEIEWACRLMPLTVYPLEEIRNLAFMSLLRDSDPRISWATAQLALEFSIRYKPEISKDGHRDYRKNKTAHKKSLRNALKTLSKDTVTQPASLPPAWIKLDEVSQYGSPEDDLEWGDPDPSFCAHHAARFLQHSPIEVWCQSDAFKPMLKITLERFVMWTSERLMPSWNDLGQKTNHNISELIEWTRLLGCFIARAAPYFEIEVVREKFLAPFMADDENVLYVLAPFANQMVCRHVLDSPTIPLNTLDLLDDCVDRVIRDRVFDPESYHAGEVHNLELSELIKALLFVAVEKAEGSSRFTNGDWSEINLIMPLVTRLVSKAGWSTFVMRQFLILCERAGAEYPLDDFAAQANSILALLRRTKNEWTGTTLPAQTASIVQSLSSANFPLQENQARELLRILDLLIDIGDRRSVALEQSEAFRNIQRPQSE